MVQHGAYALLMDYYYSTEKPIPSIDNQMMRICSAFDEHEICAVMYVLNEFFVLTDEGYVNNRVEEELEKRRDISEKRRNATLAREAKRKKQEKKGSSIDASFDIPNDDTSTSTSTFKKDISNDISKKAAFEKFWEQYPRQRRGDKQKAFTAYKKALTKDTHENIYAGLLSYAASDEVERGYAKGCVPWLNDSRWLNDYSRKGVSNGSDTAAALREWAEE